MARKTWKEKDIKDYIEKNNYYYIDMIFFKGKESRILIWCGNLNHEPYEVKFNNFYNNKRCPYCKAENTRKRCKHSYEYIKEYIESFSFTFLSDSYNGNKNEIIIECPLGHIDKTTFSNFQRRKEKCTECSNRRKYEYEFVKNYIESFGHKLLSEDYINNRFPLEIKCPKGHTFLNSFDLFKKSVYKCPICSGLKKYEYEFVKNYIESFGHKLLSEDYINCSSSLDIKCDNGHIYHKDFNDFKNNESRCPYCRPISKGETYIRNFILQHNIYFEEQKILNNCKNKDYLPFDFYIPSLNLLIEYDGKQHYKYGCFGGDLLDLMNIKYRDNIKTNYCQQNNIKLIRIPYWDYDNVEEILTKELNL